MIDISSFFRDKSLDPEKLRDFGFSVFAEGGFVKDYPILQKKYLLKVYVTNEGQVDFRVFDSENGEEYLPAHVFNATGSLVGEIHHECEVILCEISQHCFVTGIFKWEQSKRILGYIRDQYKVEPEFLWSSLPECAVLRVSGKKSWFAVVGRVNKDRFGLKEGGKVEILNLKEEPKAVKSYINAQWAFPAYHMNKQHWYTLFLDDRIPDEKVINLIAKNYVLINKVSSRKPRLGS